MGSESLTGTDDAEVAGQQLQSPQAHDDEHRHAADSASAGHFDLPSRRAMTWWFAAFTVYAGVTILTGHADGTWAAWACGGYAVTTILLLVTRNWLVPLAAAVGGALIAPLFWLITRAAPTGEVVVISQSANYLLKHGTPYLPQPLLTSWESYNPYLPFMEIFGLPRSAGLASVVGDPRIWTTLVTIVALAAAFTVVSPHRIRDCRQCRNRLAWLTTVATVSPVIAFPLSVGVTDPPVIALTCLTLALAYREQAGVGGLRPRAGLRDEDHRVGGDPGAGGDGVGPVRAARGRPVRRRRHRADRDPGGRRRAGRAGVAERGQRGQAEPDRVPARLHQVQDARPEPAPWPPDRRARPAGHAAAVALMVIAVIAFVAWLLLRPPRDVRDAAFRLAVGYAALFTLDPSTRFGYYAYPLALLGWLALTPSETGRPGMSWLTAALARTRAASSPGTSAGPG